MPYHSALIPWIEGLESRGQTAFALTEALDATGLSRGAFLDASERLLKRGRLIRPRQGFYVPVPTRCRDVGEPFATDYFKEWMEHEGCEYYVAFLQAASWHGASHQAAMSFQVVADKRIPSGFIGRHTYMHFSLRRDFDGIRSFIVDHKHRIGNRVDGVRVFKVSSPELTLLDLVRSPILAGGIDNIANVAIELAEEIDPTSLADCSTRFSCSVVQRAGYLLDIVGHRRCALALEKALNERPRVPWAELDTAVARVGHPAVERNHRWRVIVRIPPDSDIDTDFVVAN